MRPEGRCLCPWIATVDNRTGVFILQHPKERTHPFNSARLLALSLRNSGLWVARRAGIHDKRVLGSVPLPPDTALLYPRSNATPLRELPRSALPRNLLLLDGTWSHAHRLYMDNAWLRALPHVSLQPERPSRYRIRREPKPHCLSTLEAAVSALQVLEPQTRGLDGVLAVFDRMNDDQVCCRRAAPPSPRLKRRRQRAPAAVPPQLRAGRELVVVYGESAQLHTRRDTRVCEPLQWAALRSTTGETFERFVRPGRGQPTSEHLRRMELSPQVFASAVCLAEAARDFQAFLRPTDVVVAWNASTLRMLSLLFPGRTAVSLKHVYANLRRGRVGTLDQVLERERIPVSQVLVSGRAGTRLANATAVSAWLSRR